MRVMTWGYVERRKLAGSAPRWDLALLALLCLLSSLR